MIIWRVQNCFSFNHTAFSERVVVTMTLKVNGGFLKMSPIMPNQSRYSRIFLSTSPKKVRKNLKLKISAKQWKLVQNEGEMKWNGLYMATTINRFFKKKIFLFFKNVQKLAENRLKKSLNYSFPRKNWPYRNAGFISHLKKMLARRCTINPYFNLRNLYCFCGFSFNLLKILNGAKARVNILKQSFFVWLEKRWLLSM